jgi:hypothetical protein
MYTSYYDVIAPALGKDARLILHDTDSFLFRVPCNPKENVAERIGGIMDYSNYDTTHKLYSRKRKNQIGFFKDEVRGGKISEVCALRSKVYSFKTADQTHNKCKGVKKAFSKKIRFADYKKCVSTITSHVTQQYTIRSKNHVVSTVKMKKLSFSSFCDKRALAVCGHHSYPYNSKLIRKNACFYCKKDNLIVSRL